jgi:FkbM family methyltransferase
MYKLLCHNINQNNLNDKIIPFNKGVFCYEGIGKMNLTDLDGGGGNVEKRYTSESSENCNFGGIGLGNDGESITLTTIDNMGLENIGFIHCDAQGSETFIFSKGLETIRRDRPFILYENNVDYSKFYYDNVCNSYPEYREDGLFDIKKFCIEELKYWGFTDRYNGEIDTLLIP